MGVSNFFYQGAKTVKNFVKAKLSIPARKAGTSGNANFRQVGKVPGGPDYKVQHKG